MKKKVVIIITISVCLLLILILFSSKKDKKETLINSKVKFGSFQIKVTTSGELEAKNSTKILGPQLTKVHIWNATIQKIVPEGTVVDSGDFVASINASEVADKLDEAQLNCEIAETEYSKTKLDTALELRQLRDKLVNLKFAYEEAGIKLEQSKYEPPATVRQEEINKEKAQRAYQQELENYKMKVMQAVSSMREVQIKINKERSKMNRILEVQNQLSIFAPKSGMIIYTKDWDGNKVKEGSQINTWNPIVAELPDLNKMVSKTYINEIDISKVNVGQNVSIGIDAFPELFLSGNVTHIANIGEQLNNSDAKVFEVIINIDEVNESLRPGMTTSNDILIEKFDSVYYAPIETVFGNDSINWVYKSNGVTTQKQQVLIGKSNENEVIIEKGVVDGDKLLFTIPENEEKYQLNHIDG